MGEKVALMGSTLLSLGNHLHVIMLDKNGDTISGITSKYNTTYQKLDRINNIENTKDKIFILFKKVITLIILLVNLVLVGKVFMKKRCNW